MPAAVTPVHMLLRQELAAWNCLSVSPAPCPSRVVGPPPSRQQESERTTQKRVKKKKNMYRTDHDLDNDLDDTDPGGETKNTEASENYPCIHRKRVKTTCPCIHRTDHDRSDHASRSSRFWGETDSTEGSKNHQFADRTDHTVVDNSRSLTCCYEMLCRTGEARAKPKARKQAKTWSPRITQIKSYNSTSSKS